MGGRGGGNQMVVKAGRGGYIDQVVKVLIRLPIDLKQPGGRGKVWVVNTLLNI